MGTGSKPCSSRTPVSFRIAPVLLYWVNIFVEQENNLSLISYMPSYFSKCFIIAGFSLFMRGSSRSHTHLESTRYGHQYNMYLRLVLNIVLDAKRCFQLSDT